MDQKNNLPKIITMFPRKGSFAKSENQDDDETISNMRSLSICSDSPRSGSFFRITQTQKSNS